MMTKLKSWSVWIENNDGNFSPFHDRQKTLTKVEFKKFLALQSQSGYGTITIVKPKSHEITNFRYVPYEDRLDSGSLDLT